jgi:hypothetical protein
LVEGVDVEDMLFKRVVLFGGQRRKFGEGDDVRVKISRRLACGSCDH